MASGPNKPDLSETLLESAGEKYTILVRSDPMKLRAFLTIKYKKNEQPDFDARAILGTVKEAGIQLADDARERLDQHIQEGYVQRPLEVACGVEPQTGESARPDWKIEMDKTEQRTVLEDGRVDYREKNLIVQVKEGEVIFETIPATRGAPGTDVCGEEIPGRMGDLDPFEFGANVEYDKETRIGTASVSGQVLLEDGVLRVETVFRVDGDIDFETGNIDYDGEVVVTGNVADGFRIKAAKDIEVRGSVFAATLISDGDIRIGEGATMREKGLIECGGSLTVKHLNGANIRAKGDVIVSSEIIGSEVRTMGRLLIPNGNIFGGTTVALGGVEARQLGSPMSVATRVIAGIDPEAEEKADELKNQINTLEKLTNRILEAIRPFLEDPQNVLKLPTDLRDVVKSLVEELVNEQKKAEKLRHQLDDLMAAEPPSGLHVLVKHRIYQNVTLRIRECVIEYRDENQGPLDLVADEKTGAIVARS